MWRKSAPYSLKRNHTYPRNLRIVKNIVQEREQLKFSVAHDMQVGEKDGRPHQTIQPGTFPVVSLHRRAQALCTHLVCMQDSQPL